MKRLNPPTRFSNLKAERMWSLEFSEQNFPQDPFVFHVLLKTGENIYEDHGYATTATDAFKLRRELVAETGITRFFIRAKRLQNQPQVEEEGCCDLWRDAFQSGDESLIPTNQMTAYRNWAAKRVEGRREYSRS